MVEYIFPLYLSLRALQHGPYKNTAYAISELIDNSWDAGAKSIAVVLLVGEDDTRPHTIAVLDDGCGMNESALKRCIQYGHGQPPDATDLRARRQRKNSRSGRLGRFGVGLVAASFSQSTDLQIYSWQNGEISSTHGVPSTALSCSENGTGTQQNILPEPSQQVLPDWASKVFIGFPTPLSSMKQGTLVIWRNVTSKWKKADTLRDHLLELCGRIYREFIKANDLSITVTTYKMGIQKLEKLDGPKEAQPVDPTFLSNWDEYALENYGFTGNKTLFQPYTGHVGDSGTNAAGDYEPYFGTVRDAENNALGSYIVTASYRSERVVKDEKLIETFKEPGDAPYGKLASRLQGVSILRNGREIALDPAWLRTDKTVDRWVSVSLDFDPSLDSVFGVSNDKQQVHGLAELAPLSISEIKSRINRLNSEIEVFDWESRERLEVTLHVKELLKRMQALVGQQREGARADKVATADFSKAPFDELKSDGDKLSEDVNTISMDHQEPSSDPEKTINVYGESLSGDQPAKDVRPKEIMERNLKIDYVRDPWGTTTQMFHIALGVGHMVIHFHEQHPICNVLTRLLMDSLEHEDPPTMQDALRVIRGLIASFARMLAEAEELDNERASQLQHCLLEWSKHAAKLYRNEDD